MDVTDSDESRTISSGTATSQAVIISSSEALTHSTEDRSSAATNQALSTAENALDVSDAVAELCVATSFSKSVAVTESNSEHSEVPSTQPQALALTGEALTGSTEDRPSASTNPALSTAKNDVDEADSELATSFSEFVAVTESNSEHSEVPQAAASTDSVETRPGAATSQASSTPDAIIAKPAVAVNANRTGCGPVIALPDSSAKHFDMPSSQPLAADISLSESGAVDGLTSSDEPTSADSCHYDAFIIANEDDEDNRRKFENILVKFCKIFFKLDLRIRPELQPGENVLEHLQSGLECSRCRLIFIDDGFKEKDLPKFAMHLSIIKKVFEDKSIIPVKAYSNISVPKLIVLYRPVDVQQLLCGKRLEDVDVNSLEESDIDVSLMKNLLNAVLQLHTPPQHRDSATCPRPPTSC